MGKYLVPGSISHGTLKSEDLAAAILKHWGEFLTPRLKAELANLKGETEYVWEVLWDAMDHAERYVPYGYYVGAHEGDRSDLGVWPIPYVEDEE